MLSLPHRRTILKKRGKDPCYQTYPWQSGNVIGIAECSHRVVSGDGWDDGEGVRINHSFSNLLLSQVGLPP